MGKIIRESEHDTEQYNNLVTEQDKIWNQKNKKTEGITMKANFNGFELTSKNAQAKESAWGADRHQHHIITVKRDGKRTSFDFWQSKAHPLIDSEERLISAFACFVDDASYGSYDIDEFFREFGYEKASEGIKAWKGCQSAKRKLDRLYDGDIYELLDSLEDYR